MNKYVNNVVPNRYGICWNDLVEGERLETKVDRVVNNKEPIKDGAPTIYTDRREGVRASTNIRTDRFEVAIDAMDTVSKSYKARREEKAEMKIEKGGKSDDVGEAKSTPGEADSSGESGS